MSVPMRKDKAEEDLLEENLTTADLAQGKRPAESPGTLEDRPRPVLAERARGERVQDVPSAVPNAPDTPPLFPRDELDGLRNRWSGIQADFVDEPRRAVEQADGLVASAMKRLAEVFAEERSQLERQWDSGDNVSTEDLRIALQRYRSFFHRLLSI